MKMNPELNLNRNPYRDNPNSLLDTIIDVLGIQGSDRVLKLLDIFHYSATTPNKHLIVKLGM